MALTKMDRTAELAAPFFDFSDVSIRGLQSGSLNFAVSNRKGSKCYWGSRVKTSLSSPDAPSIQSGRCELVQKNSRVSLIVDVVVRFFLAPVILFRAERNSRSNLIQYLIRGKR